MLRTINIKYGNEIIATYQQVGKFWTGIFQERKLADTARQLPFQFSSFQEMQVHVDQHGLTLDPAKN